MSARKRPAKSKTDWARVRAMRYEDIIIDDDNPAFTDEDFARAVVRVGGKIVPRKEAITLRLDADVLAWFKAQGPDYQTRINELLRAYMNAHNETPGG